MAQVTRRTSGTQAVRESVEEIWLAGLGALALTEEEGGKFFRTLVKKGEGFEKKSRARLDGTLAAARGAPSKALTKLEHTVDDTVESVWHRLGVPTRREISGLTRRIEGLAQSVEKKPRARRVAPARARKVAVVESASNAG